MPLRIVKLGGSLLDLPGLAERFGAWLARQPAAATLLVVGGGRLADAIRALQQVHRFDDRAAHYLCLDAMGLTATLLCELLPGTTFVRQPEHIDRAATGVQVIDVRPILPLAEPLPESWSVTSDSIAAHLATLLAADELVLLKSTLPQSPADGAFPAPQELAAAGLVDEFFPQAVGTFLAGQAATGRRVRLVNLRDPDGIELVFG
ncbi:MAG TPA: hypothetical protein VMF30_09480 [Pirellulales bacterium]|nr:hypothetical protein [Pirellulales bacterium]